jgi:hypothetical protein
VGRNVARTDEAAKENGNGGQREQTGGSTSHTAGFADVEVPGDHNDTQPTARDAFLISPAPRRV